ncbi:hypothetical protein BJ508DRAFT_17916 [Ascobolus immersus RN42]|uniref:Uncharacterized protein n=1 Tax=Ascobolus immersus RN42 TaxID=1160509 RepID=A0A3N4I0Y9_ASCIM|nr:hypothetical protein BJ508DRAFT_17916 [Ascobolus immersus RN42]
MSGPSSISTHQQPIRSRLHIRQGTEHSLLSEPPWLLRSSCRLRLRSLTVPSHDRSFLRRYTCRHTILVSESESANLRRPASLGPPSPNTTDESNNLKAPCSKHHDHRRARVSMSRTSAAFLPTHHRSQASQTRKISVSAVPRSRTNQGRFRRQEKRRDRESDSTIGCWDAIGPDQAAMIDALTHARL